MDIAKIRESLKRRNHSGAAWAEVRQTIPAMTKDDLNAATRLELCGERRRTALMMLDAERRERAGDRGPRRPRWESNLGGADERH